MLDEHRPAVLRGFDTAVADIGDQLHLCQPLLSFEGDPTLYVARRLDWQDDRKALAVADPSEASERATLLPDTHRRTIASGEAVVAVGTEFVRAAKASRVQLDGSEMDFARVHDAECWISVATPARFANLKTRLADEARTAFDEDLGDAARRGRRLSERGNAALLLLRRCGPRRRDDLAIRQLAGARQNREFDLYRRLLIRFSLELRTQENELNEKVERHIALAVSPLRDTTLILSLLREYDRKSLRNREISALNLQPVNRSGKQVDRYLIFLLKQICNPNAELRDAMEESNPWKEMHLDSGDFGEDVQRNPDYVCPKFFGRAVGKYGERPSRWRYRQHSDDEGQPNPIVAHKSKAPLLLRSSQEQAPRKSVIPAKAGVHFNHESLWIPASAGMTD